MTWISPTMTANDAPSPYVVSASSEYSGLYAAWRGSDGSIETNAWASASGTDAWWKIYCGGASVNIDTITVYNQIDYGMHNWKLQGSNDDNVWTDIYTGHSDDTASAQVYNSLSNSNYYLWYRIYVFDGYNAAEVDVKEFVLSGTEASTSTLSITELEAYEYTSSITEILVSETASITDTFSGDVWTTSTIAEIVTLTDTMTAYYLRDSINESISLTDVMIGSMLHDLIYESTSLTDTMSAIVGNEVRRRRVKVNW